MSLLCYNFDAKLPYTKIQGKNITKDTKLQPLNSILPYKDNKLKWERIFL